MRLPVSAFVCTRNGAMPLLPEDLRGGGDSQLFMDLMLSVINLLGGIVMK